MLGNRRHRRDFGEESVFMENAVASVILTPRRMADILLLGAGSKRITLIQNGIDLEPTNILKQQQGRYGDVLDYEGLGFWYMAFKWPQSEKKQRMGKKESPFEFGEIPWLNLVPQSRICIIVTAGRNNRGNPITSLNDAKPRVRKKT